MRRAYNDTAWLIENDKLVGISLGCDFCAEHEWGVKGLKEGLGVPKNTISGLRCEDYTKLSTEDKHNLCLDISAVKTTTLPPFTYKEKTRTIKGKRVKTAYFGIEADSWGGIERLTNLDPNNNDAELYKDDNIVSAWDSSGFMIHVQGEENIKHLRELKKAFEDADIIFGGGLSKFDQMSRRGMSFGILSRLDPDIAVDYYSSNVNRVTLYEKVAQTHIYEELREAKKGWYALEPGEVKDTGELKFFLNPQEQHKYNSGWFNLQDLKDWANNTGNIIKETNPALKP